MIRPHRRRPHAGFATAFAAVAAVIATFAGVTAAHAAGATMPENLIPENRLGDLTVSGPATRTLRNAGDPDLITTTIGCPEHFRATSRTFFIWADGTRPVGFPADTRLTPAAGSGLDGQPLNLTGSQAAAWTSWSVNDYFVNGVGTYVVTCDPGDSWDGVTIGADRPIGDAKYFTAQIVIDKANNTWHVVEDEPEKTDTTTTGSASAVTAISATLTASVSPSAATGTVTFKNGNASLGTATLSGGSASLPVSGLTPQTAYAISAEYGGDATHNGSTGTIAFTTPAAEDSSASDLTVTVPQAEAASPTGLKIAVKPGAVTLTGSSTRTAGAVWTATGQLGDVTVNDDRQNASGSAWTLSGKSSAFTDGTKQISATYCGWTPTKVSGAGTAGAAVDPGSNGGLSTDKPLATGTASAAANVQTRVNAGLTINVPADAEDGNYSATLTLTLI